MNGVHDMGGMMGFGPVAPERDEPVFHAEWERRFYGLRTAMAPITAINIDESRFRREQTTPEQYLTQSYYENMCTALIMALRDKGFVTAAELTAGHSLAPLTAPVGARVGVVAGVLTRKPYSRDISQKPKFSVGGQIRVRNMHPKGHTRVPRYVRGHVGEIVSWHGAHVFPDSNAMGQGEAPQHLYTVRFLGTELWGAGADPTLSVSVEAWESYLETTT